MAQIYRSTTDRKIAGVCAGIGEHLKVDPMLVRLGFIILALAGGPGILGYLIAWVVIPEAPALPGNDHGQLPPSG